MIEVNYRSQKITDIRKDSLTSWIGKEIDLSLS